MKRVDVPILGSDLDLFLGSVVPFMVPLLDRILRKLYDHYGGDYGVGIFFKSVF